MPAPAPRPPALSHKVCDARVERKAGAGDRVRRFVFSTDALDRDNEVVLPRGIDTSEFLRNPVFIWAHKYDIPPIGRVLGATLADGGRALVGDVEFARTELADEVFGLYRDGFLKAVSVGFRALAAKPPPPELTASRPELARCSRVITACRLYEVSAVPIPSNPEALIAAVGKGLRVSPSLLREIAPMAGRTLPRLRRWVSETYGLSAATVGRMSSAELDALEAKAPAGVPRIGDRAGSGSDRACAACGGSGVAGGGECGYCKGTGVEPGPDTAPIDDGGATVPAPRPTAAPAGKVENESSDADRVAGPGRPGGRGEACPHCRGAGKIGALHCGSCAGTGRRDGATADPDREPRDGEGNPRRRPADDDDDETIDVNESAAAEHRAWEARVRGFMSSNRRSW
jgi:uncharacterized protein